MNLLLKLNLLAEKESNMRNSKYYLQLQKDAEYLIEKAAKILIDHEKNFVIAKQKDEIDAATDADTTAEKLIREFIASKYPTHSIYGEEFGETTRESPYTWIIDPLDGTKEFMRGSGEYGSLLAVKESEKLVVGVFRKIGHTELYSTSKGNGATCNSLPIHVSSATSLFECFIGTHMPTNKHSSDVRELSFKLFKQMTNVCYRVRPSQHDAQTLAWVANGVLDGAIIPIPEKIYDVAPSLLLIEESGGKITDFNGKPVKITNVIPNLIASNGKIHDQLLNIVHKS